MVLRIYDKKFNFLAEMKFQAREAIFTEVKDEKIRGFIEGLLESGVLAMRETYKRDDDRFTMIAGRVFPGMPFFELDLKKVLETKEYIVRERDLKGEDEIKVLLEGIPDDNEDKKWVLENLPNLSYLQRIYLMRELGGRVS